MRIYSDCYPGGPSQYNNRKGIQCKIEFYPLPDPAAKTRKNAKPPVHNISISLHEDWDLRNTLTMVMGELERKDLLECSQLWHEETWTSGDPNSLKVVYTIPRTDSKQILLKKHKDYGLMMDEVLTKPSPAVTLTITEILIPMPADVSQPEGASHPSRANSLPTPPPDTANPKPAKRARKQVYACFFVDEKCGVDEHNPPPGPPFDFLDKPADTTDIALLARSRVRKSITATAPPAQAPVVINTNFQGLAEAFSAMRGDNITPKATDSVIPTCLPPVMSLVAFCLLYSLTPALESKLRELSLAGPHVLRKLENADLKEEGLSRMQIAKLRNAEERWLADVAKDNFEVE
ncbi:hypothetical protein OF83DRAFT_1069812 [Amylostereum chailletii]|nr:hypothetical protein OF83DRAFT_1069812 [Amylostereum chailletii]